MTAMLQSADDARRRANIAGASLRIVNELAASPLIAAVERGDARAVVPVDEAELPITAGLTGRVNDSALLEILERGGHLALARACRIFSALGFSLSSIPEVESVEDADRVGDLILRIRVTRIELGFAAADAAESIAQSPLLQGVALPPAHLWRARAEGSRLLQHYERKALAMVSQSAERGADSCRLSWRDLSPAPLNPVHLALLAEALRGRGFTVDSLDAGSSLRLKW